MRDRMAGPETGLFLLHKAQQRALAYEGGGLLDGPSLFSVENGRCIRLPLPGTSDTQRLTYATNRSIAQRRFTDNDCTHCISCLLMAGSRHPNAGRAQSAPSAPETGFQCTDARMTYLHTRLNDFTRRRDRRLYASHARSGIALWWLGRDTPSNQRIGAIRTGDGISTHRRAQDSLTYLLTHSTCCTNFD